MKRTARDYAVTRRHLYRPPKWYENSDTIVFGDQPLAWEQLFAAAGDYVVGFVIEDLDGNQYLVYTQITVQ